MDEKWNKLLLMDYKAGITHEVTFGSVIDSKGTLLYPVVDGRAQGDALSSGKLAALGKVFGRVNLYEDSLLGLSVHECTPLSCVGGGDLFRLHKSGGDNPDWLIENLSMNGREDRFLFLPYMLLKSMHNVWFGYSRIPGGVRLYLNHNDFSLHHGFATHRLDFYDDHVAFFSHRVTESTLPYSSMRSLMFGGAYSCR